mgnify:FL=1
MPMSPQGPDSGGMDRRIFDEATTSLTDLLFAIQNGVVALNALNTTLGNVFPQQTATSTAAATAGAITYTSSQAAIFISVVTSSGGVYRVPGYL